VSECLTGATGQPLVPMRAACSSCPKLGMPRSIRLPVLRHGCGYVRVPRLPGVGYCLVAREDVDTVELA
jgi:hypothetical protein